MEQVLWIAGLSNGETATEGKGNFTHIEGALSPWQRLLRYMADNNLTLTSLSLYSKDGRRWNMASSGKNPKFHAFAAAPKPVSLRFFRKLGFDIAPAGERQNEELYAVIEAFYENGTTIQLWVDDATGNCWTLIT